MTTAEHSLASIVIRTRGDRHPLLSRAMASVTAQTYDKIELVVVEDGSEKARGLVMDLAAETAHAVAYLSIDKGGRSAAGNAGVARTTGDFIGFLDDDDALFPDHLATLAALLTERPAAPAAYAGSHEARWETGADSPPNTKDLPGRVNLPRAFSLERLWQYNFLPIQSVLFRRAAWERCGGFDPALPYLEDWDLWLRLAMLGDFAMADTCTSRYRVPADDRLRARRTRDHNACKPAIRRKQRALLTQLPPERQFVGIESIASGHYDRVNRVKEALTWIPFSRAIWRRLKRMRGLTPAPQDPLG